MKIHSNLILLSAFLLILLHGTIITAQELEDERGFDYDEQSPRGPSRWGDLKSEWADCKNGQMQSPIDVLKRRVIVIRKNGSLVRSYKPANASLINRGHDIEVKWVGDAGSIRINETDYFLKQCHWHSPTEHAIDGRRYALELHMVHQSRVENKIAVVALLYEYGLPDHFIRMLEPKIMSVTNATQERNIGVVDPREIKMRGSKYYRYMGSLTTPPCTEDVIWIINKKMATVSRRQVKLLRDAVQDNAEENARPIQPTNGREVRLYLPWIHASATAIVPTSE